VQPCLSEPYRSSSEHEPAALLFPIAKLGTRVAPDAGTEKSAPRPLDQLCVVTSIEFQGDQDFRAMK